MSMPVRRFTVDEFHRMIQAGNVSHEERVELLDGWITRAIVGSPAHAFHVNRAQEVLRGRLPGGWGIRTRCGITLATSETDPDVAVVLEPASRYRTRLPGPADIALVVEVADSSLAYDRDIKGHIYAQANLAEYWIVNLVDHVVEVYTNPSPTGYLQRHDPAIGDVIPLSVLGQVVGQIGVVDLLG
jgi:hypothetical protein